MGSQQAGDRLRRLFARARGERRGAVWADQLGLRVGDKLTVYTPTGGIYNCHHDIARDLGAKLWWQPADASAAREPDSGVRLAGVHPRLLAQQSRVLAGGGRVVHVAFADAEAFAKWEGKSLPTEAEWEYAASNGHRRAFQADPAIGREQAKHLEESMDTQTEPEAPKGKLPYIRDDGRLIGDTTLIIEHLKAAVTTNPQFCLGYKDLGLVHDARGELAAACTDAVCLPGDTATVQEMEIMRERTEKVLKEVEEETGAHVHTLIGTMIEVPRAAVDAVTAAVRECMVKAASLSVPLPDVTGHGRFAFLGAGWTVGLANEAVPDDELSELVDETAERLGKLSAASLAMGGKFYVVGGSDWTGTAERTTGKRARSRTTGRATPRRRTRAMRRPLRGLRAPRAC